MIRKARRPDRLLSIDVLRGAAALAVVAFHAIGTASSPEEGAPPWLSLFTTPASLGFSGVFLFFVISGFCIHLGWARQAALGNEPSMDVLGFWKRRIRRLYPPYLVALALYVALQWPWTQIPPRAPVEWDLGLHLLMLHNLDPRTALTINGVFWTLAIEEQLYLAYFLLVALRRSLGWLPTLGICLATRVAWFAMAAVLQRTWGITIVVQEAAAVHWFVWALGAWSVEAWFGLVERPRWVSSPWTFLPCLLAAAGLSLLSRGMVPGSDALDFMWLVNDPLWGVGFFVLVNHLTSGEISDVGERAKQATSAPFRLLGKIGAFSYSLYLTHELVLTHLAAALSESFNIGGANLVFIRGLVLCPAAVALAWVFFVLFERPFLTRRPAAAP